MAENNNEKKVIDVDVIAPESADELVATKDFTKPEDLYKQLIDKVKTYHPSTDITQIEKAFNIANSAHQGTTEKIGRTLYYSPAVRGADSGRS